MLRGLHAAHEATDDEGAPLDVVHHDVSPENVIVGLDGVVRIFDFGIAVSRLDPHAPTLSGKIGYIAPEQLRGGNVDRRADVYASAIVLWELLTGERLFAGAADAAVVGRVLFDTVPQPSTRVADVPPLLDEIVARGLAHEVTDRYTSADDMLHALEAAPLASASDIAEWTDRLASLRHDDATGLHLDVEPTTTVASISPSAPRRHGVLFVAMLGLPVGVLIILLTRLDPTIRRATPSQPSRSIVVTDPPPVAEPMPAPAPVASSVARTIAPRRIAPRIHTKHCDPPYIVGPDDIRHYKRECL
jgi:serine/threonine-protein kinase